MTSSPARPHARIDFEQPLQPGAARLQQHFAQPLQILSARNASELHSLLATVEAAARAGQWCLGGLCYEAASALDAGLPVPPPPAGSPPPLLACFAIYAAPLASTAPLTTTAPRAARLQWTGELSRPRFDTALARIHDDIRAGRYYQLNLTQRYRSEAAEEIDLHALFAALQQAQPGGYALQLELGEQHLLSVSPELFFDWQQPASGEGEILTRPMKGTAARGATAAADEDNRTALRSSAKERAENLMIVDLLRNDLGRIACLGSVRTEALFATQPLPTVWQMTSDVRARLPAGTTLLAVLQALFPCGSVTGAPKRSAMAAIAELEASPRGWYCGALGVVRSDGAGGIRASFNVPIRTLVVDSPAAGRQQLSCGIGSGITYDAVSAGEWQEWANKRRFFERVSEPFSLLETFALDEGRPRHLEQHLARMAAAAKHFGYPWQAAAAHALIRDCVARHPRGGWRLRLQLAADGSFSLDCAPLPASPPRVILQWANRAIDSDSEFVRFKTSRRQHYEAHAPVSAEVFDTLLWNEAGELTECTRGNIAVRLDGRWLTPALASGLLPGIARARALADGQLSEAVLPLNRLAGAQAWAFLNSLRGWIPAEITTPLPR